MKNKNNAFKIATRECYLPSLLSELTPMPAMTYPADSITKSIAASNRSSAMKLLITNGIKYFYSMIILIE